MFLAVFHLLINCCLQNTGIHVKNFDQCYAVGTFCSRLKRTAVQHPAALPVCCLMHLIQYTIKLNLDTHFHFHAHRYTHTKTDRERTGEICYIFTVIYQKMTLICQQRSRKHVKIFAAAAMMYPLEMSGNFSLCLPVSKLTRVQINAEYSLNE